MNKFSSQPKDSMIRKWYDDVNWVIRLDFQNGTTFLSHVKKKDNFSQCGVFVVLFLRQTVEKKDK